VYGSWVNQIGFNHCVPGSDVGIGQPSLDKQRVVPGDPAASLVMEKITDPREACTPFHGRMPPPPRPRLRVAEIETIRRWIAEGAADN
jgi:hypothetical protein